MRVIVSLVQELLRFYKTTVTSPDGDQLKGGLPLNE